MLKCDVMLNVKNQGKTELTHKLLPKHWVVTKTMLLFSASACSEAMEDCITCSSGDVCSSCMNQKVVSESRNACKGMLMDYCEQLGKRVLVLCRGQKVAMFKGK